ncbi:TOMM precursor leader peptide-binding protein [Aeromonas enteropelogenes]|uniref:TOMM precursor leader peptide-binding protein n=1 Tax=Aeromonas enteropelogenes TaxID=29489 RepID=UPI002285CF86|nr:TOMM precursor leader peptide-binding protein [Aeromonas enteropelogenes]MCZ0753789.1 TOMM precursor leader peptide-binding protein [Aeromonas enteropelogenes]
MPNQFTVLKASKLSLIDRDRVQLRFPDNNHVTLEFDSKTLQEILTTNSALSREDWIVRITQCGVTVEEAADLLDGLIAVGAIHAERMTVSNAFDALLAHEDCRSRQVKQGDIDDFVINCVGVYGTGELARITQDAADVVFGIKRPSVVEPDMVFVCCDIDDMPTLLDTWKTAPEARLKIAFWFDGGALRLGPVYVPGESACISCFVTRTDAASQFIDEAVAYHTSSPLAACILPLGLTIASLATYIVMRTFHLAKSGQFNVLEPGTIETWAVLTGMSSKKFVLRNPFCPGCSDIDRPKRAIRDMT